jgi:hypothetical protein
MAAGAKFPSAPPKVRTALVNCDEGSRLSPNCNTNIRINSAKTFALIRENKNYLNNPRTAISSNIQGTMFALLKRICARAVAKLIHDKKLRYSGLSDDKLVTVW